MDYTVHEVTELDTQNQEGPQAFDSVTCPALIFYPCFREGSSSLRNPFLFTAPKILKPTTLPKQTVRQQTEPDQVRDQERPDLRWLHSSADVHKSLSALAVC